jgi:1-acyl-sn-glycerol-3-phosphate acyltransferase
MIARRLSLQVSASGPLPVSGLVVSNHLSYLDILYFSSLVPCIFVSKSEVLDWPLFGILARCGGTIFIERGRGTAIESVSRQIAAALDAGIPIVLFPEGTSTDGSEVLSFYPSLFEYAAKSATPVYPSAIAYEALDAREADLCYYGDITFGPHLLGVLACRGVHAKIAFPAHPVLYLDRKSAARTSRKLVVAHRAKLAADISQAGSYAADEASSASLTS